MFRLSKVVVRGIPIGLTLVRVSALLTLLGLSAAIARADTIISAQFGNSQNFQVPLLLQQGPEPDAAAAVPAFQNSNVWNPLLAPTSQAGPTAFNTEDHGVGQLVPRPAASPAGPISFSNLLNNLGVTSGVNLSIANINGGFNTLERAFPQGGPAPAELPDSFVFSNSSTQFTFSGLAPNSPFTLFIYATDPVFPRQQAVFSVGNSTFDTENGTAMTLEPTCCVFGTLTGTVDASGDINGTWNIGTDNPVGEIAWSGFQLVDVVQETVPEPNEALLLSIGLGLLLLGVVRRRAAIRRAAGNYDESETAWRRF